MERETLTAREREVLTLMAAGKTNGEISRELAISFATAKAHVSSILAKAGAATREEAVAHWRNTAERRHKGLWLSVPLLLLLGAAAVAAAVIVGGRWFAARPADERPAALVLRLSELEAGAPRHFELDGFGASAFGTPYGVWVTRSEDGSVTAFFDRDPHSGCAVDWQSGYRGGDYFLAAEYIPQFTGAYKDPCGGWVYLKADARIVFGASPRGLDSFAAAVRGDTVTLDLLHVQLGLCRLESAPPACSAPGEPVFASVPPEPVIPDWAHE